MRVGILGSELMGAKLGVILARAGQLNLFDLAFVAVCRYSYSLGPCGPKNFAPLK
jgi:hypothetical protein